MKNIQICNSNDTWSKKHISWNLFLDVKLSTVLCFKTCKPTLIYCYINLLLSYLKKSKQFNISLITLFCINIYHLFSIQAAINFYCQEKLYRHVQRAALEAIKKYGSDPVLLFFKGYGLILEGKFKVTSLNWQYIKLKTLFNIVEARFKKLLNLDVCVSVL